jgi:uncharacterized membrane protein
MAEVRRRRGGSGTDEPISAPDAERAYSGRAEDPARRVIAPSFSVFTETSGRQTPGAGQQMSALQDHTMDRISSVPSAPPHLGEIIARVVISLATAVVVPAALFATTVVAFGVAPGMIVALAWVVGATVWRWATRRPVSGLLLLTLGMLTLKTCVTLVTGNTYIYFVQPVFVDATVAVVFLTSLWSATPVVARLAPDFYPIDAAVAARPAVSGLFRRLTLLWGLVILVKGGITLWLLESLSTVHFVVIKGSAIITLTLLAAAATVVWAALVGRAEGLLGRVSASDGFDDLLDRTRL